MSLHNFSDGDVLEASQLNDSFESVAIRRNSCTEDTAVYNNPSVIASWADMGFTKTFTPDQGTNSLLTGLSFAIDAKEATGEDTSFRIKITNNTNSAVVYAYTTLELLNGNYMPVSFKCTGSSYATITGYSSLLNINVNDENYGSVGSDETFKARQEGASYTVTIQAVRGPNDSKGRDVSITNINITMYWTYLANAEISSWA